MSVVPLFLRSSGTFSALSKKLGAFLVLLKTLVTFVGRIIWSETLLNSRAILPLFLASRFMLLWLKQRKHKKTIRSDIGDNEIKLNEMLTRKFHNDVAH